MTFKENMVRELNEKRLQSLEQLISDANARGHRYLKIEMEEGADVVHKWLFSYRLLPTGQAVWDKLVSLGFQPEFTWGGDWAGPPGIHIGW